MRDTRDTARDTTNSTEKTTRDTQESTRHTSDIIQISSLLIKQHKRHITHKYVGIYQKKIRKSSLAFSYQTDYLNYLNRRRETELKPSIFIKIQSLENHFFPSSHWKKLFSSGKPKKVKRSNAFVPSIEMSALSPQFDNNSIH